MVGPISREERDRATLRLKLGAVLVVAASAGLISVQGDAPPRFVAVAVLAGAVVGAALVWFVFPGNGEVRGAGGDRRRGR